MIIITMMIAAIINQVLAWFRQHATGFMDLISLNPYKIPVRSIAFILQIGKL